ncbi:MAG: ABC transporter transmembrane domain-containing protein [Chitinophagales bacterium]
MKQLKIYLNYVKPYWLNTVLNIVFNLLTAVFSVFSLLMLIPFLQLIFQSDANAVVQKPIFEQAVNTKSYISDLVTYQIQTWINTNGKVHALLWVCCITLLVFFLKNIFRYLALHFLAPMRTGIASNIRQKIYDKLLLLDIAYFAEEQHGKIMTKMTNDVQEIEYGVLHFLEIIFKEPITILITLITMLIMSPQLTLFVLIILPLSGYVIGKIGKSLKQSSHIVLDLQSQINQITNETINGIKVIKAYNASSFFRKLFFDTNEAHHNISTKMLRKRDLSSPLSEFLGIGVVVIVLFVGGRLVLNETSSLSAKHSLPLSLYFLKSYNQRKLFQMLITLFKKV